MEKDIFPARRPDGVYACGDGAELYYYADADFPGALTALAAAGWAVRESWSARSSAFAALEKAGQTLCLTADGRELRAVRDPFTAPAPAEDPCERRCETYLWQFETDHSLIDCGMCYIVRCADNSFFIVDSGHFLQTNDDGRLLKFLRERTPAGERTRIAGWLLTHAHSDHVCKFMDFLRWDSENCDVEAVYYNFPEPGFAGGDDGYMEKVRALLASRPGIRQVKLHSGQRFAVRDLRFTVLCTHEDVFPAPPADFNDSSLVTLMEAGGSRVLFCGDACRAESAVMVRRWGELLESDVVQVAHHGHYGCTAEFYSLVNARAALFPNTRIFFRDDLTKQREANAEILRRAREYFVSSDGTAGTPLPEVRFTVLPDETTEDFEMINRLWGYEYTTEEKRRIAEEFEKNSRRAQESAT